MSDEQGLIQYLQLTKGLKNAQWFSDTDPTLIAFNNIQDGDYWANTDDEILYLRIADVWVELTEDSFGGPPLFETIIGDYRNISFYDGTVIFFDITELMLYGISGVAHPPVCLSGCTNCYLSETDPTIDADVVAGDIWINEDYSFKKYISGAWQVDRTVIIIGNESLWVDTINETLVFTSGWVILDYVPFIIPSLNININTTSPSIDAFQTIIYNNPPNVFISESPLVITGNSVSIAVVPDNIEIAISGIVASSAILSTSPGIAISTISPSIIEGVGNIAPNITIISENIVVIGDEVIIPVIPLDINIDSISPYVVHGSLTSGTGVSVLNDPLNIIISTGLVFGLTLIEHSLPNMTVNAAEIRARSISPYTINDSFQAYDGSIPSWFAIVNENIGTVDISEIQLLVLLEDFTRIIENIFPGFSSSPSIHEVLTVLDVVNIIRQYRLLIEDGVSVSDNTSPQLCTIISDYISIKDVALPLAIFSKVIAEELQVIDSSIEHWFLAALDTMSATDVAGIISIISKELAESVSLEDALSVIGVYSVEILESLSATDLIKFAWSLVLNDSLSIQDTSIAIGFLSGLLAESVGAIDIATPVRRMYLASEDSMIGIDAVNAMGSFGVSINEAFSINLFVVINDESYECFVLNTSKFYPSIYSGFNFNSYCMYQGRTFAAGDDGIMEIIGNTDLDNSINTGIVFHETDFAMPERKKFRKAYLGISGDNPIMIMESDNGEKRTYSVSSQGTVSSSRAVKGRTWQLSIADFDTLDGIKLIPVILSRGK